MVNRRQLVKGLIWFISACGFFGANGRNAIGSTKTNAKAASSKKGYNAARHQYGMGIEVDKCIGCGKCVEACTVENNVPDEPFFTRTWVERYVIKKDRSVVVENIGLGNGGAREKVEEGDILRSFYVPKLCNQCENPPCVQVCPVGATFATEDGVVLVDEERCIGCRYCIQACPYGARYLHPKTKTADKCTFCYHRIVQGLLPACVEVCPTQARIFGDLRSKASRLVRFERMNKVHVLKHHLNTEPKVYYAGLDGAVR
jgi:Fe-S-cluster-containing dehydrogenase component